MTTAATEEEEAEEEKVEEEKEQEQEEDSRGRRRTKWLPQGLQIEARKRKQSWAKGWCGRRDMKKNTIRLGFPIVPKEKAKEKSMSQEI